MKILISRETSKSCHIWVPTSIISIEPVHAIGLHGGLLADGGQPVPLGHLQATPSFLASPKSPPSCPPVPKSLSRSPPGAPAPAPRSLSRPPPYPWISGWPRWTACLRRVEMVLCSPVMVNGELEQGLEQACPYQAACQPAQSYIRWRASHTYWSAPPPGPDYHVVGVHYLPVPHQPIIVAHVQSDHYNWEMSWFATSWWEDMMGRNLELGHLLVKSTPPQASSRP